MGRISPIKNIETLLKAIPLLKDSKIKVELVGPAEAEYLQELKSLIDKLNVKDRVIFSEAIYNTSDKISKIDSAAIFVLPSKSEAMPQSLIEAMVRGKVVIGSDNLGDKDLIEDGKNGYLFKIGDAKFKAKVQKNLDEGTNAGVGATPTSVVYNMKTGETEVIEGALPYDSVKQTLDKMLGK
jgi:glycosyltransferase involved in cell wall biosynthesis